MFQCIAEDNVHPSSVSDVNMEWSAPSVNYFGLEDEVKQILTAVSKLHKLTW